MKGLRVLVAAALAAGLVVPTLAADWMIDYKKALAKSKATGKPILADFTGSDWCGWCIKLKKEVFSTPKFSEWAKKNVILLELDYPRRKPQSNLIKSQNASLAEKYGISGYPTILFLDSKGKVIGRYGYDSGGPDKWTARAGQMIKGKKV